MPRRGPYTPLWRPPSRAIRRNDDAPTSDRKFIRNDLEPTCNVALFPPRPTFFSSKRRDKRDIPDNAPPPARTVGNYGLIPRNWNNSVSEPRRSNNCPISLRSQLSSIPPFSIFPRPANPSKLIFQRGRTSPSETRASLYRIPSFLPNAIRVISAPTPPSSFAARVQRKKAAGIIGYRRQRRGRPRQGNYTGGGQSVDSGQNDYRLLR